jgi:hypothetical protein
MSQATVRSLAGNGVQQGLEGLIGGLPGLVNTATSLYVDLLKRGLSLAGQAIPSDLVSKVAGGNDCCSVPTQDCPPRCVAEVCWEACSGETQRAVIDVKNTGQQARDVSFGATPLGPAQVDVSPSSAALAPGQSIAVTVVVPPNEGFKPGETYTGEVLIRGAYEQCVCLSLKLATPATARVKVSQGEVPKHVTELQWYRHWQCTEPCVTDRGRGGDGQDAASNVRG